MNHLKWLGHSSTILDMQKKVQHENSLCDVKIINGSGKAVYAHKVILFLSSDFFKTIFKTYPETAETCTVLIPDIKDHILENILDFIYTGSISLSSTYLSEFLEHINNLGIKSAISFECQVTNQDKTKTETLQYENLLVDDDASLDKDVIEEDDGDMDAADSCVESDSKNIQYLEVYNTSEGKIGQYSIEGSVEENNSGDYILTENADNTFTLTEQGMELSNSVIPVKGQIETDPLASESTAVSSEPNAMSTPIKIVSEKKRKSNMMVCGASSTSVIPPQSRAAAFDGAVQSVIDEGISLQKAAEKFNVSKTVLWRRVKKHPAYNKTYRENPVIEAAIQKLERGESLKSVSHALQIPMSTLHRHKMRLADEGRLPENIQIKRRDLESKENLKLKLAKAVEACLNGMSQNHAATVYEVPKSTLWRHLQRKTLTEKIIVKMEVTESDNDKLADEQEETTIIEEDPFST